VEGREERCNREAHLVDEEGEDFDGGEVDASAQESPSREKRVGEQICVLVRKKNQVMDSSCGLCAFESSVRLGICSLPQLKLFLPAFCTLFRVGDSIE
jgi:hypothetical protein